MTKKDYVAIAAAIMKARADIRDTEARAACVRPMRRYL